MDVSLTPQEAALVQHILQAHLSDLRMEIADTDNYDLRQRLKETEANIKRLLSRLEEGQAAA